MEDLRKTIMVALNVHSAENASHTPDYVLATYLVDCLNAFDRATLNRAKHYDPNYRGGAANSDEQAKRDCKR